MLNCDEVYDSKVKILSSIRTLRSLPAAKIVDMFTESPLPSTMTAWLEAVTSIAASGARTHGMEWV